MNIYSKKCYVYWIHYENHENFHNEGYIGVSINPEKRFLQHKSSVVNGKHINYNLHIAFKNSQENIIQTILFEGDEKDCYNLEEQLRNSENIGWNINKGGTKPPDLTGKPRSKLWKENISKGKIGGTRPPISEETRNKMSKSAKGKVIPKEQREKIKNTLIGIKHTEERKKNQSKAHKNRVYCYDLVENVYCHISTNDFKNKNDGRFVGVASKKIPK